MIHIRIIMAPKTPDINSKPFTYFTITAVSEIPSDKRWETEKIKYMSFSPASRAQSMAPVLLL